MSTPATGLVDVPAPGGVEPAVIDGRVGAITVLYDSQCPVCRRARSWVEGQATHVAVRFVAAGSSEAQRLFPDIDHGATLRDITVIDDRRAIYRGDGAWITILWAVVSTRDLANDVAMGRKRRLFTSIKGAAEMARSITAATPTPPAPNVPPPPFTGWNAPHEPEGQRGSACSSGDTCR